MTRRGVGKITSNVKHGIFTYFTSSINRMYYLRMYHSEFLQSKLKLEMR